MNIVDIYGFRPLGTSPFALLAPFEFLRFWKAEAIRLPFESKNHSTWTEAGEAECMRLKAECEPHRRRYYAKLREMEWLPGTHYEVRPPHEGDKYYVFPDIPALTVFRQRWIIVRRSQPVLPCITGKRPTPYTEAESDGR